MKAIDLKDLLEAGCHFGHKTNKWNPKAAQFIYKAVGDTHIIDLAKTKEYLENAAEFVRSTAANGGVVLFVGTKRQASSIIKAAAERVEAAYFNNRWIGGFITNWFEVKKNIDKILKMQQDLKSPAIAQLYTKRERMLMERDLNKLLVIYGGVLRVTQRPQALFIIDVKKEYASIDEANQYKIPTAGIVDTNADPSSVTYPVPANDDAVGSLTFIINYIADAYKEGKEEFAKKHADEVKKREAQAKAVAEKAENDKKQAEIQTAKKEAEGKKTPGK